MRPKPTARLLAPLLVLAFVVGCSDDDGAAPDPSSTTAAPTTAAPATSPGQAAAEQTIVISDNGMLGWWEGGRWVQARGGEPTPFATGREYAVVRLDEAVTTTTSTSVRDPEEFCGTPQVVFDPELPDRSGQADLIAPVAVHGVPEPRPRPVTLLDTGAAVYVDAAREVLAGLGVQEPEPQLVQVVRADLAGDGTDEVLVVAEQLADPTNLIGEPGDYSVLFLRQAVDGEVRTTVLDEHRKEASEEPSPYILVYRVAAVADLNGDGVMEVATEERYYEGSATIVRALDAKGALSEVLVAGCGV
ncbi:MAG TPA: hypothetical protein VJ804_10010 [Acidimicrobiales bacterium]|nr:hypothetical protein [Acidimicrobiales bacterium]